MDDELLKYFIERTDARLTEMDQKLDDLVAFKWRIMGGAFVLGILGGLVFDLLK